MPRLRRSLRHHRALPRPCQWVVDQGYEHLLAEARPETGAAAWALVRDELVADWIAEQPGTRPEAWWRHAATEPLRIIKGEDHPQDGYAAHNHRPADDHFGAWHREAWPRVLRELQAREPELRAEGAPLGAPGGRRYHFGRPATIQGGWQTFPEYEPEHHYLERLDLLTAEERRDFESIDRAYRFEAFAWARWAAHNAGQYRTTDAGQKQAKATAEKLDRLSADLEACGELAAATTSAMASRHRLWNDPGGAEDDADDLAAE